MENFQQDQFNIHNKPNVFTLAPPLSSGLGFNSSFRPIGDESFPYISGIFDETMYTLLPKGPETDFSEEQENHLVKNYLEVTSENKMDNQLPVPADSRDGIDFSTCITSTQSTHEDFSDVTPTNSDRSCESSSGADNSVVRGPLKNDTFNLSEDHKEKSVLNCTTSVITETPATNMTFENKPEKPPSSTFDGPGNVTTELPADKLNCTFDQIQTKGRNSGTFHSDKDSRANSNKSLNITEDLSKRGNGVSDGETGINLDVSHCSSFSLDDVLDLKPFPIVASTPIVLGNRFGLQRPTETQQHLSVIHSMDSRLNKNSSGASKQKQNNISKTNVSSTKVQLFSQDQKVPPKSKLNPASQPSIVQQPKPAFTRNIPQPSAKVRIPKTLFFSKPSLSQVPSLIGQSKMVASSQTVNRPGTSSSALTGMRRMVQHNKEQSLVSAKNMSDSRVKVSDMEKGQQDQSVNIHRKPNVSTLNSHLSSGLSFSSPFRQISDESLPYISGIFDDTVNALISKGPEILSEEEKHSLKTDLEVTSEIKMDNKLPVPADSRDGVDFSTCVNSTQSTQEDFSDATPTNSRTDDGSCESSSGTDSSGVRGPLKNGTFNLSENHKEKSVLNCTTSVITETPAANMTFENKSEKPLSSTFDGPGNVTTELPADKLNFTFDQIQTKGRNSGTFHSDKDSEKCCTFTKDPTEPSSRANSNKSLNITEDLSKRRNGVSDGETYINLDVSHCSLFSLDGVLDLKPCPIVASTPIVLESSLAGFGLEKPTEMQQRLSVINSMDSELNEDLGGTSKPAPKDASESNQSTTRSERPSKIQNVPTSLHSASVSAPANKPLSKLPLRGKIPQPSTKVNIAKTQILRRLTSSQVTCQTVKSRIITSSQTVNQPGTSSSALTGMRRMVLDSKGKNFPSTKNMSSTVKKTSLAPSTVGCTVIADSKASKTHTSQSKLPGLQPPDRGKFGFKPSSSGSRPASDAGHSQSSNKTSAFSGFPKKRASGEPLPLGKRKKDLQNQPVYANLRPGGPAPKRVTAPIAIRPKINTGHQ